jgi:uncharacterized protein (TIGR00369 family)
MTPTPGRSVARPLLTVEQVSALIDNHFPQVHAGGKVLFIEEVTAEGARLRLRASQSMLRPGGTVSGPTMFMLADVGIYVAIIARLGEAGLQAVTTGINLNFLSRPPLGDLVAQVHLLRVGKRLAVAEVEISSDGVSDGLVAHVTATYALPPPAPAIGQ